MQDLPHEEEEIEQPALRDRRADRSRALPFAESLTLDVGMRDVAVILSRVRLLGHHVIARLLADLVPGQHDAKGAEANPFQLDRER